GSISFTGVNQSTPFGSVNSQAGWSTAISMAVTSFPTDLVLDALTVFTNVNISPIPGPGQAVQYGIICPWQCIYGGASTQAGAASVMMSWSFNANHPFAWVVANIRGA